MELLKNKKTESSLNHIFRRGLSSDENASVDDESSNRELFQFVEKNEQPNSLKGPSLVTKLIENVQPTANCNPFLKYVQFDAQVNNLRISLLLHLKSLTRFIG